MPELATLGWDRDWDAAFAAHRERGLVPGRVAVRHRGAYDVLCADGELRARASGRLRHEASSPADLPVVGDWVALEPRPPGPATIHAVLPRRRAIARRAPGDPGSNLAREQVLAANVDLVFAVASLADELRPRVLERYLALAWESGAQPVILLTKADLAPDPDAVAAAVSAVGGEVPVHAVSARTGLGLDAVRAHLAPGVTAALLGPSGAGKSTLVNTLAGAELLATGALRRTGAGRHTTTRRELIVLPGGGLVVDNPGMRELHLWASDERLGEAFADVAELERRCRFSDCRHETEPGCAIKAALAEGTLAPERWRHYRELQHELAELEERLERRRRSRARRRAPGAGGA